MISRRALLLAFAGLSQERGLIVSGRLTDAGDAGHYALGSELALIAKTGSPAAQRLDPLVDAFVTLTVLPE